MSRPTRPSHTSSESENSARDGFIHVRGACENNLQNVDVSVPRDQLVVFTGVSGSGKSSLAFGTIYAESQRRFFESVAPYARRLIRQVGAPKVDHISGLPPAIALQQQRGVASSRSTVGTLTTLSSSLRLLFSRAGTYPRGTKERLDAESFSPNTPAGACPECHGLGELHTVTEASLVPDPTLSIRDGAIAGWPGAWQGKNLRDIVIALGYDVDIPWQKLPKRTRHWLLFTDEQPVVEVEPGPDRNEYGYNGTFVSAKRHVLQTLAHSTSERMRERALRYVVSAACAHCGGSRLNEAALAVRFAGHNIAELNALALQDLAALLQPTAALRNPSVAVESVSSGEHSEVAVMLARDLVTRIEVLVELGLGYLSGDRAATTLSAGEAQRLRIATALRSGLFGVVYVLDEPAAGLHPADAEPLFRVLQRLKASGNSVFVVEHDMTLVRRADWLVDVGPGAGERGGEVLYSGPVAGLQAVERSVTRLFLTEDEARAQRALREPKGVLRFSGITQHNLQALNVEIPLGVLVAITGVSGSGKSTLMSQVLPAVIARKLAGTLVANESGEPGLQQAALQRAAARVTAQGLEQISRMVQVDQKPIGRTPRSNLATYTGLFDEVRKLFAATKAAKARKWGAGHFSFNVSDGRCQTCQGEGFVSVELVFLPGTYSPCPTCHGARYDTETLRITYRGKNIAEVLFMTVEEAAQFFVQVAPIARSLQALLDVGLGYLRLGQPAPELSGGEAQRIKLASELQRTARSGSLYIFDEPTTSLHPADIALLLRQLQRLVDAGHSVWVVEHELGVIADSDWVIDLGPGAGAEGGRIVAEGTPADITRERRSRTGQFLARRLARTT